MEATQGRISQALRAPKAPEGGKPPRLGVLCSLVVVAIAAGALTFASGAGAVVAGAGFTTFDETVQGCNDSPNGINCNNYDDKGSVYMSGGPSAAGLSDGSYYFAVLEPGTQNGGFIEGAIGNLSDTTDHTADGHANDLGSGDAQSERTFAVSNHEISSYAGNHAPGTSPNGRDIIGLAPFDDTNSDGGVYILAICKTDATKPSECKYDAFRIDGGEAHFGEVSGKKYYDANTNGKLDAGEVGIGNGTTFWPVDYQDGISGTWITDASGNFSASLVADDYTVGERVANSPWMQTGNLFDQTSTTGGATATLNNKVYTVHVVDDSTVSGLNFGNVCVGGGGGLTLGFWSNRNGQALISGSDRTALSGLNLIQPKASSPFFQAFDPTTNAQVKSWLLNATATNMAYMLSAQLAAMTLNVQHNFVDGNALIYAPGTNVANANGFATVSAVMAEANAELGLHGYTPSGDPARAHQEALKNALDNANNNKNFVQPGPSSCPDPLFP
jgi:hypothetical protein